MTYNYTIPCWCYKEIDDPSSLTLDEVDFTAKGTIRIKTLEGYILYGIYPQLPRVPEDVLEHVDILVNRSVTNSTFLYGNQALDYDEDKVHHYWFHSSPNSFNLVFFEFDYSSDLLVNQENCDVYMNNNSEEKEINNMSNIFGDLRTGKAGSKYAITYFGGIAFEGKTYHQGKIFEAQGMTFPFDMLYLIPTTTVAKGDIIEKDFIAYYVLDVESTGAISVINLEDGKQETLIAGGPFGMTMYSKLFNPFGQMKGDNAFGNMMLMQAMTGDGRGDSGNAMMLAMLMSQGGFQLPTFTLPQAPLNDNNIK